MPRRELLTEAQREVLTEPTTDERTMVRYYTLGAEDRALIVACCCSKWLWWF